jgi:hypothetical protein
LEVDFGIARIQCAENQDNYNKIITGFIKNHRYVRKKKVLSTNVGSHFISGHTNAAA